MQEKNPIKNGDKAMLEAKAQLGTTPAPPQADSTTGAVNNRHLHVDTINQVFSLFRVNYHNQFYAAFSDSDTLNQAKRMWLNATGAYNTETLLRSTKTLIENSEYLPTLHQFLRQCDEFQFKLPAPYQAYCEACNAADAPGQHRWSHPSVYHAGKAVGWYALRSLPEKQVFPKFQQAFEKQKSLLREGENLDTPKLEGPGDQAGHNKTIDTQKQKKRLEKLRREVAL